MFAFVNSSEEIELNGNPHPHKSVEKHPNLVMDSNNTFYLATEPNLFSLSLNDKPLEWKLVPPNITFKILPGMSMTSTKHGLVFFGGYDDKYNKYDSALWILEQNIFRPITMHTSAVGRAYHSATWIPKYESLLITSGTNDTLLSDFFLIDIKSGSVTILPLQTELKFIHHTVILISDKSVCLYGGLDSDHKINSELFIIDITNGAVQKINLDIKFNGRFAHHATSFYGNLFVSGGFRNDSNVTSCAIFDFMHQIWLEIKTSQYLSDVCYSAIGPNCIYLFNTDLSLMRIVYFTHNRSQFVDSNDPRLIEFYSRLLQENINSNFIEEIQQDENVTLDQASQLRHMLADFHAKSTNSNSPYEIADLRDEFEQLKLAIMHLDEIAQKQSQFTKVYSSVSYSVPSPSARRTPAEILSDISKIKMHSHGQQADTGYKSKIQFDFLMGRVKLDQNKLQKISFPNNDPAFSASLHQKNIISRHVERSGPELDVITKLYKEKKESKFESESSYVTALESVKKYNAEFHMKQAALVQLKKQYYQMRTELNNLMVIEASTPLTPDIQKDYLTFNQLFGKYQDIVNDKATYQMKMPQNFKEISSLVTDLNGALRSSSKEARFSIQTAAAEKLAEAIAYHNELSKQFPLRQSLQISFNNPIAAAKEYNFSRIKIPAEKISQRMKIKNQTWNEIYNEIISIIDDLYKKQIRANK